MTRSDIINAFIKKYNYQDYLEIGVKRFKNFKQIICSNKVGVDPCVLENLYKNPDKGYAVTSDYYFKEINNTKYDIIFIDGLHKHEQVFRDIENSLNSLNENGTIVLHDCNPKNPEMERPGRNGTVWRGFYEAKKKFNIQAYVVDTDHGCGVIRKSKEKDFMPILDDVVLDFNFLDKNRDNILNLISVEDFIKKINN